MAGTYDGTVRINTKLDTNDFNISARQLKKSCTSLASSFNGLLKTFGIGLSIAGIVKLGKESIEIASDLQEVQNVVDTAFGSMSYKMEEFAQTCIEQFGLSKLSAKEMGSTFMAMASNMVPSMEQASDMAIELTGRAADMASFYNKSASETATALKAVFTGETEVLKSYGVVMTEANLQQYAYQTGIKKQLSAMTQAEKVQLRYNYVMEQTSLSMGDFAKTSDSWANQTRILSEQFKELLGILGNGLITVFTPIIKTLNTVLSQLITIANTIGTTLSKILGLKSNTISTGTGALAADVADAAASADDLTDGITSAGKAANKALAPFDELNNLTTSSTASTSSSSIGSGIDINTKELEATETGVSELETEFTKLIDALEPTKKALKELWDEGLSKLEKFSFQALKDFYNEFLVPMGKWAFATEGKGFPRLISIINDDLCNIQWDEINNNLKEFWQVIEPYAENFGEGLIDFFEECGDFAVDVINIMFGKNGILKSLTEILKNGNPEDARIWGRALGELAVGLFALKKALKSYAIFSGAIASLKEFMTVSGGFSGIASSLFNFNWLNPGIIGELGVRVEQLFVGTILDTNTWTGLAKDIDNAIDNAFNSIADRITQDFLNLVKTMFNRDATLDMFNEAKKCFERVKIAYENNDWYEVGANIVEGIISGFAGAVGLVFEPIFDLFDAIFNGICNIFGIHSPAETMMPLGEYILLGIIEGFSSRIEEFNIALSNWFDTSVLPWFTTTKWSGIFANIFTAAKSKWSDITKWWNSSTLIMWMKEDVEPWFTVKKWEDTLSGMLTGFDNIWTNIRQNAKDHINSYISMIENFLNWIISGVNSLIDKINSLSFEIPAIPGVTDGVTVGFSIPNLGNISIPRLATGTVVPRGVSEFLAVLGDNKKETEVVSPLSTMKEAVKEAIEEMGGISGGDSDDSDIVIQIDGDEIFRVVRRKNKEYKKTTGESAFA